MPSPYVGLVLYHFLGCHAKELSSAQPERLQGHVITPINKKTKEPPVEMSFTDLLSPSQQSSEAQGRQSKAGPQKLGGQPVRKLSVPKAAVAAERPQQSDMPSDFLLDLLPGLGLGPETVGPPASKSCKPFSMLRSLS